MKRFLPVAMACVLALPAVAYGQSQTVADDDSKKVESLRTSRGRLGIEVLELNAELREFFGAPKDRGVLVARVEDGSPAKGAGLQVGDVIVRVDGKDVSATWDVVMALAGHKKGDKIDVDVVRAKRDQRFAAVLNRDARPAWVEERSRQAFERHEPAWRPDLDGLWHRFDRAPQRDDQDTEKRIEELEKRIESLEKK